jgi:hypothetical protein
MKILACCVLALCCAAAASAAEKEGAPAQGYPSGKAAVAACAKLGLPKYPPRQDAPPQVAMDSEEAAAVFTALRDAAPKTDVETPAKGGVSFIGMPAPAKLDREGAARAAKEFGAKSVWRVVTTSAMGTRDVRQPDFKGQTNSSSETEHCYAVRVKKGFRYASVRENSEWGKASKFIPGEALP